MAASVQDLIALAQAQQKPTWQSQLGQLINSTVQGYNTGQQIQSQRLALATEMLKKQALQQDIAQKQAEAAYQEKRRASLLPQLSGQPSNDATSAAKLAKHSVEIDAKGNTTDKYEYPGTATDTKPGDIPFTGVQFDAVLSKDPAKIKAAFPLGIPQSVLTELNNAEKLNVSTGEKQDQFYQREWDKVVKDTDPLTASSRSGLGMATKADFQANRALLTLSKPMVTNQEAGNAMADIASIYQTGNPTEYGMSHQGYNTLYGKIQGAIQGLTGNPQDAVPDPIKQRLIGVLTEMKDTNKAVMKQNLDHYERAQPKLIQRYQDEWKGIRQNLEGGVAGGPDQGTSSTTSGGITHRWNPATGKVEAVAQ